MVQVATYFESDIRGIIDGCAFQKSTSRPKILMRVQMCFSNMCLIFRMMRTKISRCNISANKHLFGWSLSEKISCKRWRNPEKKIPANFRATQTSHHKKNGFVKSSRHARVVEASSHEIADKSSLSRQSNKNYRFRNKRVGDG